VGCYQLCAYMYVCIISLPLTHTLTHPHTHSRRYMEENEINLRGDLSGSSSDPEEDDEDDSDAGMQVVEKKRKLNKVCGGVCVCVWSSFPNTRVHAYVSPVCIAQGQESLPEEEEGGAQEEEGA
jgi:hypothetical protein